MRDLTAIRTIVSYVTPTQAQLARCLYSEDDTTKLYSHLSAKFTEWVPDIPSGCVGMTNDLYLYFVFSAVSFVSQI